MTTVGIDYGRGMTNIDLSNGIRYGVIPIHDVTQAWCDSAEPDYPCEDCECFVPCDEDDPSSEKECNNDCCEAPADYILDDGEYLATQGNDDCDIFIIKSPFYTYAALCSPCAPGACHLRSPVDTSNDDNRCYCFGEDFFDSEYSPCPYPIFQVSDNKCVYRP